MKSCCEISSQPNRVVSLLHYLMHVSSDPQSDHQVIMFAAPDLDVVWKVDFRIGEW